MADIKHFVVIKTGEEKYIELLRNRTALQAGGQVKPLQNLN